MTAADFAIVPDADAPQVIWITWAGGRRPVHIRDTEWVDTRFEIEPGTRGLSVIVTEHAAADPLRIRSRAIVYNFAQAADTRITPWRERQTKGAPKP